MVDQTFMYEDPSSISLAENPKQLALFLTYMHPSLPAISFPLHQSCLYSCLAVPRIHKTVPMPDFQYKAEDASKLDEVKTYRYSSDAKNHSQQMCK